MAKQARWKNGGVVRTNRKEKRVETRTEHHRTPDKIQDRPSPDLKTSSWDALCRTMAISALLRGHVERTSKILIVSMTGVFIMNLVCQASLAAGIPGVLNGYCLSQNGGVLNIFPKIEVLYQRKKRGILLLGNPRSVVARGPSAPPHRFAVMQRSARDCSGPPF